MSAGPTYSHHETTPVTLKPGFNPIFLNDVLLTFYKTYAIICTYY
jgi:hypothetical protein